MLAKQFYEFINSEYIPNKYERAELTDKRFYQNTNYAHVCKTRCYLVYKAISEIYTSKMKIADFGFFPGTMLRMLREFFPDTVLVGAGQKVKEGDRKEVFGFS